MPFVDYDKLSTRLAADEKADYEFQRRRHSQWKENYELYRDTVITNRLTQRQSVNIPLMKGTIKTILSNTDEFPDINFEELGNDKYKEMLFNEYWKTVIDQDHLELKDILDKKQVYLYGRSWRKLNIIKGKFTCEVREPYDILLDRYTDPTDVDGTADHMEEMNIFRTLGQLSANPNYDKGAVNRLKVFYATKSGLIKGEATTMQQYRKNERMQDMGVVDIQNPQLGETVVELKVHYVKIWDDLDQEDHIHVIVKADTEILMAKPLKKVLGIDFFPFVTWTEDPERNDIYPDGIADIVRTPNKILNVWFSQLVENRTLRNFGMNYYDSTKDNFVPQTFDAQPFGWYPVPGNPADVVQRIDIPALDDSLDEIDYIKGLVESATAATAATKGETDKGKITLGEVELTTKAAMERVTSIAKFYNIAQREFGTKFAKMVNANADRLTDVKLYKKSHKGNYFSKGLKTSALKSDDGYNCVVTSTAERDQKNIDSIQKLNAVAQQFPGNIPMKKIYDKKLLEFADVNADQAKEVMDFEDQLLKQQPQGPQGPPGQPAQPGLPPRPVIQPNVIQPQQAA